MIISVYDQCHEQAVAPVLYLACSGERLKHIEMILTVVK